MGCCFGKDVNSNEDYLLSEDKKQKKKTKESEKKNN